MTVKIFVYGTLRENDAQPAELVGMNKRTDSSYPTIEPEEDSTVEGQIIEKDEYPDFYEGCNPDDPENSLYWRLPIGDTGVHVYVGNVEYVRERYDTRTAWDTDYTREEVKEALENAELEVLA